jgi:YbgC/YbaW family acyl-CoA thioester hydrolase
VQFHETDKAGIVHFSAYFKYMEEAEHGLWRAAGLSISPRESDIGWPRVHASMDFHAALHFEEEFTVLVQVAAITTRAIRYRFLLARDRTRIATGALTVVCVRKRPRQPMRSVPIPPAIASRFRVAAGANANLS